MRLASRPVVPTLALASGKVHVCCLYSYSTKTVQGQFTDSAKAPSPGALHSAHFPSAFTSSPLSASHLLSPPLTSASRGIPMSSRLPYLLCTITVTLFSDVHSAAHRLDPESVLSPLMTTKQCTGRAIFAQLPLRPPPARRQPLLINRSMGWVTPGATTFSAYSTFPRARRRSSASEWRPGLGVREFGRTVTGTGCCTQDAAKETVTGRNQMLHGDGQYV